MWNRAHGRVHTLCGVALHTKRLVQNRRGSGTVFFSCFNYGCMSTYFIPIVKMSSHLPSVSALHSSCRQSSPGPRPRGDRLAPLPLSILDSTTTAGLLSEHTAQRPRVVQPSRLTFDDVRILTMQASVAHKTQQKEQKNTITHLHDERGSVRLYAQIDTFSHTERTQYCGSQFFLVPHSSDFIPFVFLS